MARILIIDDDRPLCDVLALKLTKLGHATECSHTLHQALGEAERSDFDVILLDVGLPDGDGLEMLPRFQERPNSPEVIIITGRAEISGARLAIETGAWDYVEKGASLDELVLPIVRALDYRKEKGFKPAPVALKRNWIIGDSPLINACLDQVAEVSRADSPVLITGESGVGKELFAWAIHENSDRSAREFVVLDCAALPETLTESILFGHEAGAYTGATRAKDGLIKEAHAGTLFLDEIGELPPPAQSSFLRVLQEKRFRRIGGGAEISSDFRIVAATNRDLEEMVKQGQFRHDLLFRLNQSTIKLPPLRDRGADLQSLVYFRLKELARHKGVESKGVSPEFLRALSKYSWPGNVRELFGVVEHAVMQAGEGPTLYAVHLPTQVRLSSTIDSLSHKAKTKRPQGGGQDSPEEDLPDLKSARQQKVAEFEKEYLRKLMSRTSWKIQEACKMAGISRPQLYNLLRKHSLSRS